MEKKTVAQLITEAREEKGLTKNQLAKMSKVSHTEIARIESGERTDPSPRTLKKISKYIGLNYNDLMYAAGLGAKISPLNPYLIDYYNGLKGEKLKNAYNSIERTINNNKIIIESLKESLKKEKKEEEKNVIFETIEDLEYQNNTNEEIQKLLTGLIVKEFADERSN